MHKLAHLQVDDSICAETLHRVKLQIPLEILSVETRNGKAVAESSLQRKGKGLKICSLELVEPYFRIAFVD